MLIIWALSYFPHNENLSKSEQLEHSYLGTMGKAIEPAIRPLGMDWKMGIGLLVAQGARELFVSTMATIYALGDVDENSNLARDCKMKDLLNRRTGVYTSGSLFSSVVFCFFFAVYFYFGSRSQ